jgi:hypothetical protein
MDYKVFFRGFSAALLFTFIVVVFMGMGLYVMDWWMQTIKHIFKMGGIIGFLIFFSPVMLVIASCVGWVSATDAKKDKA